MKNPLWTALGLCIALPFALRAGESVPSATLDESGVAAFEESVSTIEIVAREKARRITHPKHLPRLYHHGAKTRYVVLFTHGTFESPHYSQGLAEAFYEQGMNVYSILLPGHWENPMRRMDKIKYKDWVNELEESIEDARGLGDELILAGYSLGGLLSVKYHLDHPGRVKGLFLFAPALQMTFGASFASGVGSLFSVSGNAFVGKEDGIDKAYVSASAGMQVSALANDLLDKHGPPRDFAPDAQTIDLTSARKELYAKIEIPTFILYSDSDEAVASGEVERFAESVRGPKAVIHYPSSMNLRHGAVVKSAKDVYAFAPGFYNYGFDQIRYAIAKFLNRNF
ncbi:MAG: lysophospholipase [Oligoflexia bacterium]|nr:lysophospholipase [Oligoflexia bacterium]